MQAGNNSSPEVLPPFIGFLLAVMDAPRDRPLCFILPRRGDVARIAVVLHALHRLIKKQRELTYTDGSKFRKGDIVRINPSKHVFRYDGFDEIDLDYIWLQTLGRNCRRKEIAANILPRLEKTSLSRPIGRGDTLFRYPPAAPLDALIGVSIFGNQSLIKNEIAILDSQNRFDEFVQSTFLQLESPIPDMPTLKALLPFGELVQSIPSQQQSWLKKWDERHATGEPLIAVTHSSELLANYCIDSPLRSKLVVINGLHRLKHRQSYDDIADTQRLILFASRDEEEKIKELGNAPTSCQFWWFSAAEINAGVHARPSGGFSGHVSKITRWANNHDNLNIEFVPCENQTLEEVSIHLDNLDKFRRGLVDNENCPLAKLISQAWKMLNDVSAIYRPLTEVEREKFSVQVKVFRAELQNNSNWLRPEDVHNFSHIASRIESSFSSDTKLGINKGEELCRAVRETLSARLSCALFARSENQVLEIKDWLRLRYIFVEAYSPSTLPEESFFDRLICVSWPGSHWLKHLASVLVTPQITILTYPFECRWLSQCKRRLQQRPQVPTLTGSEKLGFVTHDINNPPAWFLEKKSPEVSPAPVTTTEMDIWDLEYRLRAVRKGSATAPSDITDGLEAYYVSFVGDSYAYLTPTHKLAVVTTLVSGGKAALQGIPEKSLNELKVGDYVVFPEGGNRDTVREFADRILGAAALFTRQRAHRWKEALLRSRLSAPEFYQRAQTHNFQKSLTTVRNWLQDDSKIGPEGLEDLQLIASVTNDAVLRANMQDTWESIRIVRSAHLSAGSKLQAVLLRVLPEVLKKVEENGSQIDIENLGSVWVAQIDFIDGKSELRECGEVNHLLWERSTSV